MFLLRHLRSIARALHSVWATPGPWSLLSQPNYVAPGQFPPCDTALTPRAGVIILFFFWKSLELQFTSVHFHFTSQFTSTETVRELKNGLK